MACSSPQLPNHIGDRLVGVWRHGAPHMREEFFLEGIQPTHSPIPEANQLTKGLGSIREPHERLKRGAAGEVYRRAIDGSMTLTISGVREL